MVKGRTTSGFDFEIDEAIADDYELLESLIRFDKKDYATIPGILDKIVGDNKTALFEHVRTLYGRVSISGLTIEIKEIFGALGNVGKNSLSSPE